MNLEGEDKGWSCNFWLPEVEESGDPREVIRYHKEQFELYQKAFLGLIYELIERKHISYLHHEMAGQICMDAENEDHQMWKANLNSMHGILVKEVEDINARLEAE